MTFIEVSAPLSTKKECSHINVNIRFWIRSHLNFKIKNWRMSLIDFRLPAEVHISSTSIKYVKITRSLPMHAIVSKSGKEDLKSLKMLSSQNVILVNPRDLSQNWRC